ncbi:MAG: sugar transferase [Rhodomicrobium sp.]|nr:MAG: sugar transferase [Rhodomicrobium sp.]
MRVLDSIFAAIGLILAAPLMLVIIWLIRRDSEGGAMFNQIRIGKGGLPFTCIKFRTMAVGTGDRPTHKVQTASVTKIGHILRRTKLDELPQLINVLKGEMALVGPRPCLPSQDELIKARMASGALTVLPGITGLAQVHGVDMSAPERLASIDGYYAANRNFCGDLLIILRTFTHIAYGKKSAKTA